MALSIYDCGSYQYRLVGRHTVFRRPVNRDGLNPMDAAWFNSHVMPVPQDVRAHFKLKPPVRNQPS